MRIFALLLAIVGMQLNGTCWGQEDARFQRLSTELIDEYMQANPLDAVDYGRHEQDGQFLVPDSETLTAVPLDSSASVWPSGGEEITVRAAAMPPAPGWFST